MRAIAWMLGTLASFCLMAVSIRELSGHIPVPQTLFIRSLIGLLVVFCILAVIQQVGLIKTAKLPTHVFRNLFHFGGQYGWFLGIGLLPLAEVFALEFTVPIWTAIIASIYLHEKMTRYRVMAILLGMAGVVCIVKPGIAIIDMASFIVLGAAFCYGISHTVTKFLSATEKPIIILFYMCLIQMPIAFLLSISHWVAPSNSQWGWLVIIALTALSAHFCMTKAMQSAEVTTVVMIDFFRLPLIAIVGVLLYQEAFDVAVLVGGILMLAGNMLNTKQAKLK